MKAKKLTTVKSPLRVGSNVIVRTVTHYYTGCVALLTPTEIVLTDAAWIADTGRWTSALVTGGLSEVEPFLDPVSVGRGSIIDVTLWRHELPKAVK